MRRKLLILNAEDWSFWSHRLPAARAARDAGYDVVVATRVTRYGDSIRKEGFKLTPLPWRRSSLNPESELRMVGELVRLYRAERPDLAHHIAAKPILLGTLAARLARVPAVVNTLTGTGFVFASRSAKARLLRPAVSRALAAAFASRNSASIFQNADDLSRFAAPGTAARSRAALILGSGVDVRAFSPAAEPLGTPVALLAARMLWEKGVGEFVQAARILAADGVRARFALVGERDPENPHSVEADRLEGWTREGVVEWWGGRDDMPAVYAQAHVVCLPTYYGEGLPKALLEAAASGRPLVATDWPGCREVVRDGENGLLVPVKDPLSLAAALRRLLLDGALRERMGRRARRAAVEEFSQEKIAAQTLAVYRRVLESPGRPGLSLN